MKGLILRGIDGANLLGFLAAIGVLRTASSVWLIDLPQMGWCKYEGAWRPYLLSRPGVNEAELVSRLYEKLIQMDQHPSFSFSDDLSLPPSIFRSETISAKTKAMPNDRCHVDFLSAFGSESVTEKTGNIADTAMRTMSGAGHQHFLGTIRQLVKDTKMHHIHKAMFSQWMYDDPAEKHCMRWDPFDDVRYALQWRNPSGDPGRKVRGSMWGANRLAIEALPLFPTAPKGRGLETTGFTQQKGHGIALTWPIWEPPVTIETVRSILAIEQLQHLRPDREMLKRKGIVEIFKCQRLTQGKFRNFSQAVPK